MAGRTGTVERAFELARSGRCATIGEIEKALAAEQYEDASAHLGGPLLRSQLRAEMAAIPRPSPA